MTEHHDDDRDIDLRALWSRLEPDAIDDGDDRSRDPRTEAAMAWMRAAWTAIEAPAARAAAPVIPLSSARRRSISPALAAVAALLLAILSVVAFHQEATVEETPGARAEIGAAPAPVPTESITSRITPTGDFELKKGRVRLVLVKAETRTPESRMEELR